MKLTQHPEYQNVYLYDEKAFQHVHEAIIRWKANEDVIPAPDYSLHWTYESTRSFVLSLSRLFQEYNRVIWDRFHYCRQCGGQCCIAGASDARPFDLIAISLLNQSTPRLQENITAQGRECIYLSNRRCSWPSEWRPIKCWSFYCLGAGPWKADASIGELRSAIATDLQQVVRDLLPTQLQRYEAVHGISLASYLDDPLSFSDALQRALFKIFVEPFNKLYPIIDRGLASQRNAVQTQDTRIDDSLTFIAEIAEQVYEGPPVVPKELGVSPEQLLEDLESLQWITEGQPPHRPRLLKEMYLRYAKAPAPKSGEEPTIWYRMRNHLLKASP
ncbi:MAG: hypothetical protein J2P36_01970 [Ktedonobacteraceae bacterium]|nr:hypothetical protein [Ktedonobacteraceae bacterium]